MSIGVSRHSSLVSRQSRYTAEMPVDVDALVISNTRLSAEYNVVALEAPEIASRSHPGQFVMVKPARGFDPLLRRPFSVFEVLKDRHGTPSGLSLLNKRVGPSTRQLAALEPGDRMPCLGPLGRPFTPVDSPASAWMVAGGVGLAPFATLAERLRNEGVEATLFYGARQAADLFYLEWFERLGVCLRLATEDGSRGEHGLITAPLERALDQAEPPVPAMIYACGPTGMLCAVAKLAATSRRLLEVSLEQVMGCGLGGCYSCVVPVRDDDHPGHLVRSCLEGPVFRAEQILWDQLVPQEPAMP